jgi:hypothetical protein
MNETENSGYLSNPYVLIGTALLIYWYIQRRNLIRNNKNALKSISLFDSESNYSFNSFVESEARKYNVPKQLVKDAKKMSKKECAKAILDNQKMINKTKMSQDERQGVLNMVDYLEVQLDKK